MATVQENQSPNTGIENNEVITFAGHHDVLLGRGGGTNNHVGNKNFRQLINEHKKRYLACSKVEKPKIARDVVEIWQKLDPPGRFLQKISGDSKSKAPRIYEEVSLKKAREKASQCLRERTTDVAPYLNKYHKDQDKKTEEGVERVKEKMNSESKAPAKQTVTPDQSTSAGKQSDSAQAQQKIVQAAQSSQSDLGLQELYARQQQNLREAYIADNQRLQQTAMQQNAIQQNAMQQNAMQQAAMQQAAMQQNSMQQTAMHQSAMQQTAMQMARQHAFHEQKVLEHQTKMLLQQQMAMQEQMLKNNIMAQQLMMQRNGYAMAAAHQVAAQQGLPPPATPEAARRMSLNTGFSQMAIKKGGVPPAHPIPQNNPAMQQHHHVPPGSPAMPHHVPQSNPAMQHHHHVPHSPAMQHHASPNSPAIHNSPAVHGSAAAHSSPAVHSSPAIHASPNVSAGQLMAHKMASIPVQPNLTQRNMAQPSVTPQPQPPTSFSSPQEANNVHPIPLDTNHDEIDNNAILEYTAHLEKQDEPENPQTDEKQQQTLKKTKTKSPTTKSKIPTVIATNSSDNLDPIKPATVSSSDASLKDQNVLTDPAEHLHDSGKLSHLSDYDATLQDYHTRLNDTGSHVFDDDSSEEMLKDHSALRDHSSIRDDLHSTGSCDHSLPRKKGGRKTRRTSKSSVMSMSIGSLSGMDYSADELRDHKMHSSRSFGSNRSLMSELTDYQDLIL